MGERRGEIIVGDRASSLAIEVVLDDPIMLGSVGITGTGYRNMILHLSGSLRADGWRLT